MASLGRVALAILGILAYQNRDKLGDLLKGKDSTDRDPKDPQQAGKGGLLDQIADSIGSGGGLKDVLDRFRNSGSKDAVDTWVQKGPSQPLEASQVEAAIDPRTLDELGQQTGLSREELLDRIARDLPEAIDKMTPSGELPAAPTGQKNTDTLLDDVPSANR